MSERSEAKIFDFDSSTLSKINLNVVVCKGKSKLYFEKSYLRAFSKKFQGCLPIPGAFRVFFRGNFNSRGISGYFRVSGVGGHPVLALI